MLTENVVMIYIKLNRITDRMNVLIKLYSFNFCYWSSNIFLQVLLQGYEVCQVFQFTGIHIKENWFDFSFSTICFHYKLIYCNLFEIRILLVSLKMLSYVLEFQRINVNVCFWENVDFLIKYMWPMWLCNWIQLSCDC